MSRDREPPKRDHPRQLEALARRQRVGRLLSDHVGRAGIQQKALAEKLGRDRSTVSRTLRGLACPRDRRELQRWVDALNIAGDDLLLLLAAFGGAEGELATRQDIRSESLELQRFIEREVRARFEELTESLVAALSETIEHQLQLQRGDFDLGPADHRPASSPLDDAIDLMEEIRRATLSAQRRSVALRLESMFGELSTNSEQEALSTALITVLYGVANEPSLSAVWRRHLQSHWEGEFSWIEKLLDALLLPNRVPDSAPLLVAAASEMESARFYGKGSAFERLRRSAQATASMVAAAPERVAAMRSAILNAKRLID